MSLQDKFNAEVRKQNKPIPSKYARLFDNVQTTKQRNTVVSKRKSVIEGILKGDDGKTGARGKSGSQGVRGVAGTQGVVGETGSVGKTGKQGVTGKKGGDGKDGKSVSVQEVVREVMKKIQVPTATQIAKKVKTPKQVTIFGKETKSLSEKEIQKIVEDILPEFIPKGGGKGYLNEITDIDSEGMEAGYVLKRKADDSGFEWAAETAGVGNNFSDNETPSGTVNGSNAVFTLAQTPNPVGSLQLFVNGQLLTAGGEDYTLSGTTVTMVTAPPTTSIINAFYRY